MNIKTIIGLFIPFLGTLLGSSCVFLLKKGLNDKVQRALSGFAAGVMVAASIWSLIIPSMESSKHMGKLSFIPAAVGFWVGILFLLFLDKTIPHMHLTNEAEGPKSRLNRNTMLMLAVTLHNIPEGMTIGVALAGAIYQQGSITMTATLILALGIALQNFPEGAIVSMPLSANGERKGKAFWMGTLSGAVEPLAAVITLLFASLVLPIMPYMLSFAAGAMIYVVVEELVPEMGGTPHSNVGTILFSFGFTLMMALDVALG